MKFVILISLLLFSFLSLFSEEPILKEEIEPTIKDWKFPNIEFYISPGVIPDVGIGTIQRFKLEKCYQEATVILHADLIPSVWELRHDAKEFYKINLWGIKYRGAYFYKPDYSGFNWFFNVGFQAIFIDLSFGSPGGSSGLSNPSWYGFPDLAVGCGYSWKLKNNDHFRISLDAGIKIFITNLYLSYVW